MTHYSKPQALMNNIKRQCKSFKKPIDRKKRISYNRA